MAIAVDTSNSVGSGSGSTVTLSLTLGASAKFLVVFVGTYGGSAIGTPTWNGTNMTALSVLGATQGARAASFYIGNPATGTHDVSIGWPSGAGNLSMFAISFTGAKTTVGASSGTESTVATGFTDTFTTTGTGNGIVVDFVTSQLGDSPPKWTVGSGQTAYATERGNPGTSSYGSYEAYTSGSNPSMDWTSSIGSGSAIQHLMVEVEEELAAAFIPKTRFII